LGLPQLAFQQTVMWAGLDLFGQTPQQQAEKVVFQAHLQLGERRLYLAFGVRILSDSQGKMQGICVLLKGHVAEECQYCRPKMAVAVAAVTK